MLKDEVVDKDGVAAVDAAVMTPPAEAAATKVVTMTI
jgi:hypothetical protein